MLTDQPTRVCGIGTDRTSKREFAHLACRQSNIKKSVCASCLQTGNMTEDLIGNYARMRECTAYRDFCRVQSTACHTSANEVLVEERTCTESVKCRALHTRPPSHLPGVTFVTTMDRFRAPPVCRFKVSPIPNS